MFFKTQRQLDKLMQKMPENWRYRWCEAQVCACMGCANRGNGRIQEKGFTKKHWEKWVKNNPR